MPNRVTCEKCGASYDVSKFEPGKRLRCKGDRCGAVLVVPESDAEAPEEADEEAGASEDEESGETEEEEERPRRPEKGASGREKGRPSERAGKSASGRREAEAGAREGKSASGRAKTASGRGRAAGESGRGKPGRSGGGGNKKVLIIGVVAVVVLGLGSLPFVLGGGGEKPAEKPKKGKAGAAATPEPATDPETPPADGEPAKAGDGKTSGKAPEDGAKKPKGLFAFKFVEDPAGAGALAILPKLGDEEPTKAEAARDELVKVGVPAISTSLNYLYDLKDANEANMNRIYYAVEAFKLILGEKADKVPKTGDDANPDGRDWISSRRACNTWKDWWRKNGGTVAD